MQVDNPPVGDQSPKPTQIEMLDLFIIDYGPAARTL